MGGENTHTRVSRNAGKRGREHAARSTTSRLGSEGDNAARSSHGVRDGERERERVSASDRTERHRGGGERESERERAPTHWLVGLHESRACESRERERG